MKINLHQLTHSFGAHKVLDTVSLQLDGGSVTGLLGLNGAGKTTLIRILNGMLSPDSGSVLWSDHALSPDDCRRIGYLPEERGLYPRMRVDEQLCFWGRLKGLTAAEAQRRAMAWLQRLAIPEVATLLPSQLSKGTQQKVQLAAALLHDPQLVVLDEPFSGLDPLNALLLQEVVAEIRSRGAAVLISSHNIAAVETLCDRLAILHDSRLRFNGTLDALQQEFPQTALNEIFVELVVSGFNGSNGSNGRDNLNSQFSTLNSQFPHVSLDHPLS